MAAIKLQASWRGFLARRKNLDVVRARNEIRNRRAEDHIRFLQSEVHRWGKRPVFCNSIDFIDNKHKNENSFHGDR